MKSLFAAACAALFANCAYAQGSFTAFGTVDINFQRASQGGVNVQRLNGNGANSYSALGFRGSEDLGDGLSASFWLEAALNADNGSGAFGTSANNQTSGASSPNADFVFNRRSTVSLRSKDWGEIRLGRDVTPTYWNLTLFDPFGTAGSGASSQLSAGALNRLSTTQTSIRASNALMYFAPGCTAEYGNPFGCSGFYAQGMAALGENASSAANADDGNYRGLRVGYATGAFNVSAAAGKTSLLAGDVSASNLGASWKLGFGQVMGQVFRDSTSMASVPNKSHGWLLGARLNLGAVTIPVSIGSATNNGINSPSADKFSVGYVYNFSRRTATYATYSSVRNKNGATAGGGGVPSVANATWTGVDIGLRHHF